MYIETQARIYNTDELFSYQFFNVLSFGKMEYTQELPEEIKFFKNGSSRLRVKIAQKNKLGKIIQHETDVISLIR